MLFHTAHLFCFLLRFFVLHNDDDDDDTGIPVFNTPGANANAVKELILCGLLLGSRKIVDGINHMKSLGEQGLARERVGTYERDCLFDLLFLYCLAWNVAVSVVELKAPFDVSLPKRS